MTGFRDAVVTPKLLERSLQRRARVVLAGEAATLRPPRAASALDPFTCNRLEIADFGRAANALGISYLGVCCGAAPHHIRSLAEALGRTPPASRYTADMSKHAFFGTDERLGKENREFAEEL